MDLNISPIWTNQHTFLKPVLFAAGQMFNGANIKFSGQQKGSMMFYDGASWTLLHPGQSGQSLTIVNNSPVWSGADASYLTGIVGVQSGGTGIGAYKPGDILYSDVKNNLTTLPVGKNGQVLGALNKTPTWIDLPGVQGKGKSACLAVWSSSNEIVDSNIQIKNDLVDFQTPINTIKIDGAIISSSNKNLTLQLDKDSLVITKDTFAIQASGTTVVKFWKGKLSVGTVPVDRLDGVLSVSTGGTGLSNYRVGDILYASSTQKLNTLSSENSEGFYLRVVNGKPQWAPVEVANTKTTSDTTFVLEPGTTVRAPILFTLGEMTSNPKPGALEWDGYQLYLTNKDNNRKSFVLQGENLAAYARGVTEIVPTHMGGTGKNLSNADIGSILFVNTATNIGALKPEAGKFLRVNPFTLEPTWHHALLKVNQLDGVVVNTVDEYEISIGVDTQNFSPTWESKHIFKKGLVLGEDTTLVIPSNTTRFAQINFQKCYEPITKQNGDMWFDNDLFMFINGATVNLTGAQPKTNNRIAQIQYLRVCEGESPIPNTKRKIKYPLPYGSDGWSKLCWRFTRIDWRIEDSPTLESAQMRIYVNNNLLLTQPLQIDVNNNSAFTTQFIYPFAESGDLIEIEYLNTGDSDCWSVFVTVIHDET